MKKREGSGRQESPTPLCGLHSLCRVNKPPGHKAGSAKRKRGQRQTWTSLLSFTGCRAPSLRRMQTSWRLVSRPARRKLEPKDRSAGDQEYTKERQPFGRILGCKFYSVSFLASPYSPSHPPILLPSSQPFSPDFFCPSNLPVSLTGSVFRAILLDRVRVAEQPDRVIAILRGSSKDALLGWRFVRSCRVVRKSVSRGRQWRS